MRVHLLKLYRFCLIFYICVILFQADAFAQSSVQGYITRQFEMMPLTGSVILPGTSYRLWAYGLKLNYGNESFRWTLHAGTTPAYQFYGYSENVYYMDAGAEWGIRIEGWVRPYAGLGIGAYMDKVEGPTSSNKGFVGSLVTRVGVKVGKDVYGGVIDVSHHFGVYSPVQLGSFVNWPLLSFMIGGYYAFIP